MDNDIPMTPEQRVRIMVGGGFSPASLGPLYDQILAAFDADPAAHLEAFRRLYLVGPPDRIALSDLPLGNVIQRAMRTHPAQAGVAARVLLDRVNALAQVQEREALETVNGEGVNEINRARLERQRDAITRMLGNAQGSA